jgi:hypothetical protein
MCESGGFTGSRHPQEELAEPQGGVRTLFALFPIFIQLSTFPFEPPLFPKPSVPPYLQSGKKQAASPFLVL